MEILKGIINGIRGSGTFNARVNQAFEYYNDLYFKSQLPTPTFALIKSSSHIGQSYFKYDPAELELPAEERTVKIGMDTSCLSSSTLFCMVLIREMCELAVYMLDNLAVSNDKVIRRMGLPSDGLFGPKWRIYMLACGISNPESWASRYDTKTMYRDDVQLYVDDFESGQKLTLETLLLTNSVAGNVVPVQYLSADPTVSKALMRRLEVGDVKYKHLITLNAGVCVAFGDTKQLGRSGFAFIITKGKTTARVIPVRNYMLLDKYLKASLAPETVKADITKVVNQAILSADRIAMAMQKYVGTKATITKEDVTEMLIQSISFKKPKKKRVPTQRKKPEITRRKGRMYDKEGFEL